MDGVTKDGFLPPIAVIHNDDYDSDDEDSDSGIEKCRNRKEEEFWNKRTRMAVRVRPSGSRTTANQSSMSDSFVLPNITNSSLSSPVSEKDYQSVKKARTAGGRLDHFNDSHRKPNGIPLSKSCPALTRKGHGRKNNNNTSDDFEDEIDTDRKSMSFNVESELRNELNGGRYKQEPKNKRGKMMLSSTIGEDVLSEKSNSNDVLPDIFGTSRHKESFNEPVIRHRNKTRQKARTKLKPHRTAYGDVEYMEQKMEGEFQEGLKSLDLSSWSAKSPSRNEDHGESVHMT